MQNLKPMTAWGPDGRTIIKFIPHIGIGPRLMNEHSEPEVVISGKVSISKRMRRKGHTYKQIGKALGVSVSSAFCYVNSMQKERI